MYERNIRLDHLVFGTHDMTWDWVEYWKWPIGDGKGYPALLVSSIGLTGWYRIEDGRHRATALYELGHTYALCRLVPYGVGHDPTRLPDDERR